MRKPPAKLVNLSTRGFVNTGDDVMIGSCTKAKSLVVVWRRLIVANRRSLTSLTPSAYTAIVGGKNNTIDVGMIEIYCLE